MKTKFLAISLLGAMMATTVAFADDAASATTMPPSGTATAAPSNDMNSTTAPAASTGAMSDNGQMSQ
jgi:hypothetical protein